VLDSTNSYLVDQARSGAPEGLVAVADYQTAGRGRMGRRWEAPQGANLLASVLLRPSLAPSELHLLTIVAALAAADACAETARVQAGLKWPNDLLVGERKLAGVLAESVPGEPSPEESSPEESSRRVARGETMRRAVVLGLGLNVHWPPPDTEADFSSVPRELAATATSLRRESPEAARERDLQPAVVLDAFLRRLDARLDELADSGGRARQASEYRARCTTVGREVRVSLQQQTLRGRALDVTEEGHLVVDTGEGLRTIMAGDVEHVD
jgi:BirA family transcriptional regulator, biotin operon repressor / biotin---[acetyl-CoA-carboxylase] ligase